ncbi:MAG TPA: hypothetical protein VKP30_09945, partial [Polyangiaceae bacterium]|nr:hypothetical protein [Polyangiaceae bacterium]
MRVFALLAWLLGRAPKPQRILRIASTPRLRRFGVLGCLGGLVVGVAGCGVDAEPPEPGVYLGVPGVYES